MTLDQTTTAIDEEPAIRDAAAHWAERLLDGDLNEGERGALQRWLTTHERHEREFRAHTFILNLARDLPEEVRDVLSALDAGQPRRRFAWITGLAASVLLIVGAAVWLTYQQHSRAMRITTAHSARDVELPDGSTAHMNTRTDLRWIAREDERRVELREGEALFDVKRDSAKPFTVVLDTSEIRVVGTQFNVRRRENAEVIVTVLDGTVRVTQKSASADSEWTRELHGNEQIVYSPTGLIRDIQSADGANAARWREGILEFEDEPLSNIVADLGRYMERQIIVRDPRVAALRLGGQLNVRDDIRDSLGLLEKLAPVTAHQQGDAFVLDYRQEARSGER
jgi:transmembrane sensor